MVHGILLTPIVQATEIDAHVDISTVYEIVKLEKLTKNRNFEYHILMSD